MEYPIFEAVDILFILSIKHRYDVQHGNVALGIECIKAW